MIIDLNYKKKKKFKPLGVLAGEVIGVISLSGVSQDVLNKYRPTPVKRPMAAYTEATPEAMFFERVDNEVKKTYNLDEKKES